MLFTPYISSDAKKKREIGTGILFAAHPTYQLTVKGGEKRGDRGTAKKWSQKNNLPGTYFLYKPEKGDSDGLLGLFADKAELPDEVTESIMQTREVSGDA
jgi:hypothetical protein